MITVDAPISFLVGGGLVLAATRKKQTAVPGRDRLLARGLLLQSVILTPIILYFMVRFPDWEWNYMFDAGAFFFERGDSSLGLVILVMIVAALNLSFYAGFRIVEALVQQGKRLPAQRLMVATCALIGLIMAVLYRQTLHLGSYAQFQAGDAPLIFMNIEFLIVQTLAGILVGGGIFWILRLQRREHPGAA